VLSASIVVLAMSGGGAAAATDTKSVLEVDKIEEVDFGKISGTRVSAVGVGTKSDGKVWFTAQDVLQFAFGGAINARAKQNLAAMIKDYGVPEGFHSCRWKPVDGPREGCVGSWSVSLSTLKGFVKTIDRPFIVLTETKFRQVLLARQSVAVGGAGARSLATHLHVQVRDMQHPPRPHTRSSTCVSDIFVFGRLYVTGANGAGGHVIP
jgi:hypothetical protein